MAEAREFASFKYQADETINRLWCVAIIATVVAVAASAAVSRWFLLLLLVPVGVFVHIRRSGIDRPLLIASRYLILGERIVYFRNVDRASLDRERQTLTLLPRRGGALTISADKFPTNARKAEKIRINKSAKFEKIADKIIARLRSVSPDIVIS